MVILNQGFKITYPAHSLNCVVNKWWWQGFSHCKVLFDSSFCSSLFCKCNCMPLKHKIPSPPPAADHKRPTWSMLTYPSRHYNAVLPQISLNTFSPVSISAPLAQPNLSFYLCLILTGHLKSQGIALAVLSSRQPFFSYYV